MKIGYLIQAGVPDLFESPPGGPAIHVMQVIRELQQLGHSVRLVFRQDNRTWVSDDLEHFTPVRVSWLDGGPIRWFERGFRKIQALLKLPYAEFFESLRFAAACRQALQGFDLFYERLGWVGYGGGLASRWMGIPLVLEVNGDHLAELQIKGLAPHGLQKWLSVSLMNWAAHQAVHSVATGNGWREQFVARWHIDPAKTCVIENGTSLVNILTRADLRSFKDEDGLGDPLRLVFIGGFDAWQGLPVFLRAFAMAAGQGLQARAVLIGSGPEQRELEVLISELKLDNWVSFAGKLPAPEYAAILAAADLGLSPYCGRVEFSGLKLLDYKAAGLAILASGQDGQPDILTHGQTGWIVPPCDPEALCEALMKLAAEPALRKRLGRAARLEAEQIHSWAHTAQQLEDLFERVIKR